MYAKAKKMKDDALAKVAIAKEKAKTMQDKAHSFAKKVGLVKNKDRTAAGKERLAKLKAKEDAIKRAKENAERKRLKKAEFAAKRRVEARKKAAASDSKLPQFGTLQLHMKAWKRFTHESRISLK